MFKVLSILFVLMGCYGLFAGEVFASVMAFFMAYFTAYGKKKLDEQDRKWENTPNAAKTVETTEDSFDRQDCESSRSTF